MRNKYSGQCYKCDKIVKVGDGFFERHNGKFRVQHAYCKGLTRDECLKLNEKEINNFLSWNKKTLAN